jgi:ferredoxin
MGPDGIIRARECRVPQLSGGSPDADRGPRFDVSEDDFLLDALIAGGLDLPGSCLRGWCLTCVARLLDGEVDQSSATRYYPQDREAGFVLLCTAKPRSALRLVSHQKAACQQHRRQQGLPTTQG